MVPRQFWGRAFLNTQLREDVKEAFEVRRGHFYPGEAPSASVTRRKVGRNGKDGLRQKFLQRMIDLARLPLVSQISARRPINPLQQRGSAFGIPLTLVKMERQSLARVSGATNGVSCYCQTCEGLSRFHMQCLSNVSVAEQVFRFCKIMNKSI